jgi:hypothetical protein
MLHITNGDCAVRVLSRAVQGEILPWRDVLHEGPVHAGLPLAELSRRRAAFIASAGWGSSSDVAASFRQRDERLAAAASEDEIVLWFEHDLYDQLQLLQLLDWFAARPQPRLSLVCEAEYLGTMTPARAAELFRTRRSLASQELRQASAVWGAFGSADPRAIALEPVPGLPFVAPALQRLLEEYPWTTDGLSRLERQVLEALRDGPLAFEELYVRAHHRREDPVWLGETVLAWHLERLAADGILFESDLCSISERGNEVLEGRLDAWSFPRRPRWIGGHELRNGRLRWDYGLRAIRAVS